MEKRYVVSGLVVILVLMIIVLFSVPKLLSINTPPSAETVQKCFEENREDILLLASYMNTSGFEDVSIRDSSGQAFADFATINITNKEVCNAISRLLKNKIYKHISKMDHTISFLQWTGLRDIGCGIIYSEDIEESIDSKFITEIIPLSDEGWFYYVSDYNVWRRGGRASLE